MHIPGLDEDEDEEGGEYDGGSGIDDGDFIQAGLEAPRGYPLVAGLKQKCAWVVPQMSLCPVPVPLTPGITQIGWVIRTKGGR
jgi:hypothetical protein